MVKLAFKAFGCLTILVFFSATAIFMAMISVVEAPHVRPKIKEFVYPLAIENTKVEFQRTMERMQQGHPRQKFFFSELEANALLYQQFGKRENHPVKEPYITFSDDTMRARFDISTKDAWRMFVNKFKGLSWQEAIKDVASEGVNMRRLSFTVDLYVTWDKDHPVLTLKRAYIGRFPVPLGIMINNMLDQSVNNKLKHTFGKALADVGLVITHIKMQDKYLVCDLETLVTQEYQERVEHYERTGGKATLSALFKRDPKQCDIACTQEEEAVLNKYIERMAKEDTVTAEDEARAQKMMKDLKKQPEPNQKPTEPNKKAPQ